VDEAEAYRWLQRASMDGRTTLRAVADRVVADGGVRPEAP
jgi:AmiR/NasT family two-component response regulator